MHKIPKRRLASNNGDFRGPRHLLGGEGAEGAEAALGLAGHLGQEHVPAGEQLPDRVADLGVGPSRGQHLLEHAHIARLQVVLEEVAGLLVALPQRLVLGVHAALALQEPLVLLAEQGDDERALGAEVVVQLAQRHPGLLGHLPGRQAGVAVGQQPAPGGLDDARAGVGRHVHHGIPPRGRKLAESVVRPILTYLQTCCTLPQVRSTDRGRSRAMQQQVDPTFYRTPGEAVAAPPEQLAYVAAYDPAGRAKDAMAVIDTDPSSASHGRVVGWSELPTAGNELHHFGWNACSSALCHSGHGDHAGHGNGSLERRYLVVPGLRSSRTYVLDTKPDPRAPHVVREITAEELASKAGYSWPHTLHCGPDGIFMSNLGGADGSEGPGGVALIDHDTFEVIGAWEADRGEQHFAYDVWWHLNDDVAITSEWATPSMIEDGLNPEDLL